jgi:zinc protease
MKKILMAVCWLVSAGCAQAQLSEVRQLDGVTEYLLPNGLVVLLQPDSSKPTTTVNLTYRVGSRHEGYGESGAAHLLEHMLFKATETIEDPKLEMTRRGARWNGTTWLDRTNYFAQFASNAETLDWMLAWLAESMTRAKIAKSDLDSEMTVVRNELERAENNPGRVLGGRMRGVAYQWHGYGRDTLGARSDIENMSIDTLRAFYRQHYRPDNAVLVIGGNFEGPAALRKVEQAFGKLARPAQPLPATYTREPVQDGERHVTLRRVGGNNSVALLYHVMPASQREFAAVRVLSELFGSDHGPVAKGLVNKGLAATQWSFATPGREPGYLMLGAGLRESARPEETAAQALAALTRIAESLSVTPEQVEIARKQALQSHEALLRDPERLSLALSESIAVGDWRLLFAAREWLEAVTPAELQKVARAWLLPSNRTSGIYLAENQMSARAPEPAVVAVSDLLKNYTGRKAQAQVEDFAPTPENIEARLVKSRILVGGEPGLKLAVLPRKTRDDRVTGTLRLRWGTVESVNGSAVLATLVAPLLTQGTATRSAADIQQALLSMEAQLRFTSGVGGLTANFELPARHVPAFTALLAQLLQQSSFADAEFERRQSAALAAKRVNKSDTAVMAGNALQRVFSRYAAGDPRQARTLDETEQLLKAATAIQLREFWRRFGGAGVGELALVGPVQPDEVKTLVQQHFGNWKSREPHKPWIFEYPPGLAGAWQSVQVPEKANATYTARIPLVMNEDDPQYPALFAAVNLLGGRAGTALWQRVREQEGLSYGVNSSLFVPSSLAEGAAAAININASFAPENRDKLRAAIRDELQQRAANGFSSLQVGFARRAIVAFRADFLAQNANVAGLLAGNLRWGRDMARYARHTEAYDKLDTDAVNAALKKYLQLGLLTEVAAGTFGAP